MKFSRTLVASFFLSATLGCVSSNEVDLEVDFLAACRGGDLSAVQGFLDQGEPANGESGFEGWPLASALDYGHFEIAELLVENGANVNQIINEDMPLVLSFIQAVNDSDSKADADRSQAAVDWLYEKGATRLAD